MVGSMGESQSLLSRGIVMHIGSHCRKSRHRDELGFIVGAEPWCRPADSPHSGLSKKRVTNAARAEGLGPTALDSWTGEEASRAVLAVALSEKRDERALLQAEPAIGDIAPQASVEFTPEFVQYLRLSALLGSRPMQSANGWRIVIRNINESGSPKSLERLEGLLGPDAVITGRAERFAVSTDLWPRHLLRWRVGPHTVGD